MKALVIVLNRCRPDYLGAYGNDWLTTPVLDRLAADAVVFDQHFSARPGPRAARWAWDHGRFTPGSGPGLATRIWHSGASTFLLGDEGSPSRGRRFARGWEFQHWVRRDRLEELEQDSLLGGTVQTAIEWLQTYGPRDHWLFWLELSTLQPPWEATAFDEECILAPPEEPCEPWFDPPPGPVAGAAAEERLQQTYGGVVGGVDQWLGQLIEFLQGTGLYEDMLLAVTGDVGLALGDHGHLGDEPAWLHEERVHLPLILRLPGGAGKGRRVQQFTQPVDLLPTLLEAFGQPIPEGLHGGSLLPVAHGEAAKPREYVCAWTPAEWSIRTHQWHLLVPALGVAGRTPQLFLKPEDRWEVNDVLSQHPDAAEHLELTLRRYLAAVRAGRPGDAPALREGVLKVMG
jgi:arylsulfatase A-like enzyme